jgi:Family of unknown function (DUF5993)
MAEDAGGAGIADRIMGTLRVRPRDSNQNGIPAMMAVIYAMMLASLLLGWFGNRTLAFAALGLCLLLSIGLFLHEVYSPEYGFRMPWLQVQTGPPSSDHRAEFS